MSTTAFPVNNSDREGSGSSQWSSMPSNRRRRAGILLATMLAHVGLGLFIAGFLMTRVEIHTKSRQVDSVLPHYQLRPTKPRVLLFIIDALRLDFMVSEEGLPREDNFPFMHQLLQHNLSQTLFFKLYADPPTTTSQRLKALTTGSLPTFLDINASFNSQALKEDNLIDQLANKFTVCLGDDTWNSLFPSRFNISIPFDSFNTKVCLTS
jgi:phosphatidylinositol glycan class O